jgi:plastocyanin
MMNNTRTISLVYFALVSIILGSMIALACGVESGDRRPARRDDDKTGEFHRSPVAAFEQFRVDVEKTDAGCTAEPADITVSEGARVNFAVQLTGGEVTTTATGSTQLQGEREQANYRIEGLVISSSGGAFGPGVTEVDLNLETGTRRSYSFSVPTAGAFDIFCDGDKIGTFTVN